MDILCPKCRGGELFREFEPEKAYGEDLTEYLTIHACCKMCDQDSQFTYIFCEEVDDE